MFFWEEKTSHFVGVGRKVRAYNDSLFLSLSALCARTRVLEQLARFLVGLFTNAREKVVAPACEGRELARRFFFSFVALFGALSLS